MPVPQERLLTLRPGPALKVTSGFRKGREGAGGWRRCAFKRAPCAGCGPAARALIGRAGGARGGGGAGHSQISERLLLP